MSRTMNAMCVTVATVALLLASMQACAASSSAAVTATPASAMSCEAMTANNDATSSWEICSLYTDTQLTVQAKVAALEPGGWVGFGFNPSPTTNHMGGGSVLIGFVSAGGLGSVSGFELGPFSPGSAGQTSLNASGVSVALDAQGRTVLAFTVPLVAGASDFVQPGGLAHIIFARGPASPFNALLQHQPDSGNFGTFNFKNGQESIDDTMKHWRAAHGMLMCFAWGLLIPLGIISARYFKGVGPSGAWFSAHRGLVVLGLTLAFVGFVIGLAKIADGQHRTHRVLGIASMSLGLAQPFLAALRPPATKPGEQPTTTRRAWFMLHAWVGRSAYVLAIVNVFFGLSYYNVKDGVMNHNTLIFLICWLIVMAFGLSLEVRSLTSSSDAPPFGKLVGRKGSNVNMTDSTKLLP